MNELIDAAKDSEERYERLKKEEAGTHQDEAEKRFQRLKEKAKNEFIQKINERDDGEEEEEGGKFITH